MRDNLLETVLPGTIALIARRTSVTVAVFLLSSFDVRDAAALQVAKPSSSTDGYRHWSSLDTGGGIARRAELNTLKFRGLLFVGLHSNVEAAP